MADIHNYKRRLERTIARIKRSSISEKNKELILKFHDYLFSEGLSIAKIERYLYDLCTVAEMHNEDLSKATIQDIRNIVTKIEKKEWSPYTKHGFKVLIRRFYRWVEGIDEKGVYPERVRWIKAGKKKNQQKLPEELLNEDEIERMIKSCLNSRDKALIAMLYESGCRISEIGLLRIKDIAFDEFGARISVTGKTGPRVVRLVNSVPYLIEWMNNHPDSKNPDSYVWKGKNVDVVGYTTLCNCLKGIAKRAGIKKRIYPHLFRHSRATDLAKHLTEAQMKVYFGWQQASTMAAIYVHLSGRDTDEAILAINGVKKIEVSGKHRLKSKTCPRCRTLNESTNRFCKLCGMVLDEQIKQEMIEKDMTRSRVDDLMNGLIKDKEFLEFLMKKIKEKEDSKNS